MSSRTFRHDKVRLITDVPGGKYHLRVIPIENAPGSWDSNFVEILLAETGQAIGSFERNYRQSASTFYPFIQDGKEYALFSPTYTKTSVMSLPDCKLIAEEPSSPWGFCPVEFFVPNESRGLFGFVAGCVWGDDSSWKIEFLDLSGIAAGRVRRDDRFGYVEMLSHHDLTDAVDMSGFDWDWEDERIIHIASRQTFRLDDRPLINPPKSHNDDA